ncbi:hypothetical protein I5G59_gp57 [Mycobacterium phage LilMcDreamy]|uniref:Uncharacterized protein n=1 Tax=Mycobacterium phage LilMcDreamy TaxID=2652422 RepID=A0A5P8D6M0_9CAUD|nr:hypothetical protein I5G59_gp57 [Mycobacterium phage LilMcDreamy]QFP94677.1 hypothetical protein SEA_LILMCDREAMY_57 [Mycobacterium phage LilMcDreamy]
MPDIDNPTDIGSAAADAPVDLEPVTDTRDIDWLRSVTTKMTERTPTGEPEVNIKHTAYFGITPETVEDVLADYSATISFRPEWLQAKWVDGALDEVYLSGNQRLKSGGVSDKQRRHHTWRTWGFRGNSEGIDRSQLPRPVADALRAYELAVATERNGARR